MCAAVSPSSIGFVIGVVKIASKEKLVTIDGVFKGGCRISLMILFATWRASRGFAE